MSILSLLASLTGRSINQRLASLERTIKALGETQREQAKALRSELTRAIAQQPSAKDLRELRQEVRSLGAQLDRHHGDEGDGASGGEQRVVETRLLKRLDQMAAGDGPLVVGPWTGEVGFELLYWVPFVEWVRARWNLALDRQIVVSRGGVASWYRTPEAQYADAFSFASPEAFRAATAQQDRKQHRIGAFDRQMVDAVVERRGLRDVDLLHPGLMYRLFRAFWKDDAGFAAVDRFTRYRRLEPPAGEGVPDLPAEYVAVRFYFSECFPDTPANRAFVRSTVSALAARTAVVLLDPGFQVDDHADAGTVADSSRIVTIAKGLAPERNLAVQSAVVGRARAFVGTYGGYSYLAPFYGVPAVAFYSERSFKLHHLHAAQRALEGLGRATVIPLDVAHAPLVQTALGALALAAS